MNHNRDNEYRNCIINAFRALERMREELLAERREKERKQLLMEQARAREIFRVGVLSRKVRDMHPTYMKLLRTEAKQLI